MPCQPQQRVLRRPQQCLRSRHSLSLLKPSVCDPVSSIVACDITPLAITPPGNCMEASKGVDCPGLRYHPSLLSPALRRVGSGKLCVPNISHRTAITPHEKTRPVIKKKAKFD